MYLTQSLHAIRLDPDQPAPLFRQLYEALKAAVLDGRISPGMQLPPTREFAASLGVSRQTVLNAFEQLTAEGFLSGTVGKGTFVSNNLPIAGRTATEPASVGNLHLLSERGLRYTGEQARMNTHRGAPVAFRIGMSAVDAFPFDVWARLEARQWRRPSFQLGYNDAAGYPPLRELLAAYLRASRDVNCTAEQVIVTSGSQQALYLIANLLLAPGDTAWVEDPGYPGTRAALHAADARICPVPVDDQGLLVGYGAASHPQAKLAYVTPSHQYPLGVTMSLQRRLQLLDWAADSRAWIVEDEYDSEYRYSGRPLASLQSLDKTGRVIYVGTLSKVMFAGLRLGYLVVPPDLADAFARAKSVIDRHTAIAPQAVLADFIAEGHFARHIRRTRVLCNERRVALLNALDLHLQDELHLGPADAGLHLTAAFRLPRNDKALARAAQEEGIELRALSTFYASPERSASGLLLGFAAVDSAALNNAVVQLRDLLARMDRQVLPAKTGNAQAAVSR
ncbi:MocR-like pyridoxine biosynthesis transcription factor PdxR [Noviherbaspirillum sp.]|uniref:MocR-like pyridoxine biosynthesis transcription factor PdxR n=1 Tax=Noviherbaspirillum sp. TaxID=1926288 RepID=UPI002FE34126